MRDRNIVGDSLGDEESVWNWRVNGPQRAGDSLGTEILGWGVVSAQEAGEKLESEGKLREYCKNMLKGQEAGETEASSGAC